MSSCPIILASTVFIEFFLFSEALLADSSMNTVSAQQVQAELSEVERDLTLRKLLWESQDDWSRLFEEWMVCIVMSTHGVCSQSVKIPILLNVLFI